MLSFCVLWCPADGWSWIQRSNALEHCFRIPWPPLTALPLPIAPTRSNKPSKHWALKKRRRDSDGTQRRHVHHYFRPGQRRRTSFHGCSLRHPCSNADRSQTCHGSGRQCRRRYAPVWFDHPRKQEIATLFADKGIFLLEDCAQAQGATVVGKRAGTFGDAVSFSFTRPKTSAPWATVALSSPTRLPLRSRLRSRLRNGTSTAGHRSIAWKWPAPETAAWAKCKPSSTPSSCRIWTKVMRDAIRSPSVIARKSSKPTLFTARRQRWGRPPAQPTQTPLQQLVHAPHI